MISDVKDNCLHFMNNLCQEFGSLKFHFPCPSPQSLELQLSHNLFLWENISKFCPDTWTIKSWLISFISGWPISVIFLNFVSFDRIYWSFWSCLFFHCPTFSSNIHHCLSWNLFFTHTKTGWLHWLILGDNNQVNTVITVIGWQYPAQNRNYNYQLCAWVVINNYS